MKIKEKLGISLIIIALLGTVGSTLWSFITNILNDNIGPAICILVCFGLHIVSSFLLKNSN